MADQKKIQAQLEKLIADASRVTGKAHTNVTDGIEDLISGYSQGGSGGTTLTLQNKTFVENGTYFADEEYNSFGEVTVAVPVKELPSIKGVKF